MDGSYAHILVSAGAAATGIAALLWALRVTDGARGAMAKWRARAAELEEKLARADSIFGAHPGLVLIWEDEAPPGDDWDWGAPRLYGAPLALASLMRFGDAAASADPAVRILQGLAAFDAEDATGGRVRLAPALARLRREGAAFSLTISTPSGLFVEVDGRTAGPRAVVWILDASVKGLEESGARGRLAEAHQVIARDPAAFLEMLAAAPFPAWRLSGSAKLEWANPAYLEALEAKSLDQAIARNLLLDQAVTEHARKALETGERSDDLRHVVIAGARRAMRVVLFPVAGGVGGMALDVTEAEAARDALARHQRAQDETLDHLSEGVAIFGPDKRLIFHNSAFAKMWGLDPAFLAERPSHAAWLDHLKERRKLPAHSNYAEWRAGELALYQDLASLPEALWTLPEGRTLRIARQRHPLGGLLFLFSDKTDELALRSQYAALLQVQRAALDRLHEGVAVFGLDGRLKLRNSAFEAMWGLTPDQIDSETTFDRVVELCQPKFHDRAAWARIKARITDPSPTARQEYRGEMARSDSTAITFLTRPLPDGATLIAFLDITAARRVEHALRDRAEAFEAADRLKTEFVQNVSYQLRTPLQSIQGYAEMLHQRLNGPLNERQEEHVGVVLAASRRLSDLIDDILDIAMVEAGRLDLELGEVDLAALVREAAAMAATHVRDTEVSLKVDVDPTIGAVLADEKRLKQVLFNLLNNALRFTERGDEIVVGAARENGVVRLYVSDTGRGIPYENQAGAFDNFVTGDHRGAGLGLALVKSFIQLHQGWVALQSAPGAGATVTCYFPDAAAPVALKQAV